MKRRNSPTRQLALLLGIAAATAALGGAPIASASSASPLADYLSQGFAVAEKTVEHRTLPGAPPYDDLQRVLHVSTYRLVRDERQVVCQITYDSQRETLVTECE